MMLLVYESGLPNRKVCVKRKEALKEGMVRAVLQPQLIHDQDMQQPKLKKCFTEVTTTCVGHIFNCQLEYGDAR